MTDSGENWAAFGTRERDAVVVDPKAKQPQTKQQKPCRKRAAFRTWRGSRSVGETTGLYGRSRRKKRRASIAEAGIGLLARAHSPGSFRRPLSCSGWRLPLGPAAAATRVRKAAWTGRPACVLGGGSPGGVRSSSAFSASRARGSRMEREEDTQNLDSRSSGEGRIRSDTSSEINLAADKTASAAVTVATAAVAAVKTVVGIQSQIFSRLATRRTFLSRDRRDLLELEKMVENAAAVRLRAVVESSIDSLRAMMCSCLFQSPAVLAGLIDELYIMERAFWVQPGRSEWWEKVVLPHWDDRLWQENFRMSRQTFMELCDKLRPVLERQTTNMRAPITVEKQLAIAIWKLATPDSYRSVAECFGVGRSTVSRIVMEVCQALYDVYHHLVLLTRPQEVIKGFAAKGFPHCIGAIDATHIPIIAPAHRATEYINSKGYYSMVLQALVDHEGKFTDVFAGRSGKVHDARIFRSSPIFRAMNQGTFGPSVTLDLEGEQVKPVILGDLAYPLLPWLMTPYSGYLDTRKQLFNNILGHCRGMVDYAFDRLRGRWRCLLSRLDVRERYAPRVIVACCILHNICESRGEPLQEGWEEVVRSVSRSYQQPERQLMYVASSHGREIRDLFSKHLEKREQGQ